MTRAAEESLAAASRFYGRLLRLYPKAHREAFGMQMRLTFEDSYRHAARAAGSASIGFWLAVISDECRSIVREHATGAENRHRLDTVLVGLLAVWAFATLLLPPVLPAVEWPKLLLAAAVLGTLYLTAPGFSGVTGKVATVAVSFVVIAVVMVMASPLHDIPDLVGPAVLLACLLFSALTLAGWHAAVSGIRLPAWATEELTFGLGAGLAGAFVSC